MKRSRIKRGLSRNTAYPWPPPRLALRDTTLDPLRERGALRMHAAQATLEAIVRQRLPRPATQRAAIALAGWKVDGAPPRAARGDDDLMSAPQDLAHDPPRPDAAAPAPGPVAAPVADERKARPTPWRGDARSGDGDPDALFRIF